MHKSLIRYILPLAMTCFAPAAHAFDINDILGNLGNAGSTVGNMIEGVFTTSDLQVKDIAGEWIADGPAVSFQSENFLKKAGGIAAAAAVETKLTPYYDRYGINGAVMKILNDGTFTFTVKKLSLKGTVSKGADGNFIFNFKALGNVNIGKVKTYVTKSVSSMDIMFDASKLQQLMTAVGGVANISSVKALSELLNSYEGICIGFRMKAKGKTGTAKSQTGKTSTGNAKSGTTKSGTKNSQTQSGIEALKEMLNNRRQ